MRQYENPEKTSQNRCKAGGDHVALEDAHRADRQHRPALLVAKDDFPQTQDKQRQHRHGGRFADGAAHINIRQTVGCQHI